MLKPRIEPDGRITILKKADIIQTPEEIKLANKQMIESILWGTADTIVTICEYRNLLRRAGKCKKPFSYDCDFLISPPPPTVAPSECDENESDDSFQFHPRQVATFLEKFILLEKLSMVNIFNFTFLTEDLIALSHKEIGSSYVPEAWLKLTRSQIEQLANLITVQRGFINWKNFILASMKLRVPTQDEILDMLGQFRSLDPQIANTLDKNKFDLVTLWFERTDQGQILSGLTELQWRECIYQLFCDHHNNFLYIEFLLYICKDIDPRVGFAKSLALMIGHTFPVDDLPEVNNEYNLTDAEMEMLFSDADLLISYDEKDGESEPFTPMGKINITRRMTLLRDRRNKYLYCHKIPAAWGEVFGEFAGETDECGRTANFSPSIMAIKQSSNSQESEKSALGEQAQVTFDSLDSVSSKKSIHRRKSKKSLRSLRSEKSRKSLRSVKSRKSLRPKKSKTNGKLSDSSESVKKLNKTKSKHRKEKERNKKDSFSFATPVTLDSSASEITGELEKEGEDYLEILGEFEAEIFGEVEAEAVILPHPGLISLEAFLQSLWFGHISAYPIRNQSFQSAGFEKLKELIESVFEENYVTNSGAELIDPYSAIFSTVVQHPFVQELLKRYKSFQILDLTAKLREVLAMPIEPEPDLLDDILSLAESDASTEFPPILLSPPGGASPYNSSFSDIFSCLSMKLSNASVVSGSFEARRLSRGSALEELALGISEQEVQNEEEEEEPQGQRVLPMESDMNTAIDNDNPQAEAEQLVEIMKTPVFEPSQSLEDLGHNESSFLEYQIEECGETEEQEQESVLPQPPRNSDDSLDTEQLVFGSRGSKILKSKSPKTFSPLAFGLDPKLGSLLWH